VILDLAIKHEQLELINPALKNLNRWVKEWDLSLPDKLKLFKKLATGFDNEE
jgi:hypothetical protein